MGPLRARAVAAVLLCGLALGPAVTGGAAAPSRTATVRAKAVDRGTRSLARSGYTNTRLTCTVRRGHSTTCTWTARKPQARCSGSLKVSQRPRRGRFVTLRSTHCRDILVGFNTYVSPDSLALLRSTGAKVIRLIFPWYSAEPSPGNWTWRELDQQYADTVAAGLRPLIVAMSPPCWARGNAACVPAVSGPPDAAHDPQWQEYARRLAERYPQAAGIEVWNEPNLNITFVPTANPERYTQLLALAYKGVKSARPDMPVISGGVLASGVAGEGPAGLGDLTFFQRMLAAGAASWADAFGVHPYPTHPQADGKPGPWDPGLVASNLAQIRTLEAQAGVTGKPFWITETGESTATQGGQPPAVTTAQQGADLLQIVRGAMAADDVDAIVIHTLIDAPDNPVLTGADNVLQGAANLALFYSGVNSGFGIFTAGHKAKPAACGISRELGGTLSC